MRTGSQRQYLTHAQADQAISPAEISDLFRLHRNKSRWCGYGFVADQSETGTEAPGKVYIFLRDNPLVLCLIPDGQGFLLHGLSGMPIAKAPKLSDLFELIAILDPQPADAFGHTVAYNLTPTAMLH